MAAGRGGQLKFPVTAQPVFASSSVQYHPLGTRGEDRYGREFRYSKADLGAALVAGNWIQAAAQQANHQIQTPAAAAIDDKSITITTLGATAALADQYADGLAVIYTTPGLGYSYPIKTHLANAGSAVLVVQLATGWTIQVALTTDSRVSLYANPYRDVIQGPASTLTNVPVGVAVYPIAAAEFGWLGVHGMFGTLVEDTPAVGQLVAAPSDTAGAIVIASGTLPNIGMMMDTGDDDDCAAVFWTL